MWRWLLALVVVVGIALGILFGVLNPDPVSLDLVFVTWNSTLGAVVTIAFALGAAIGCTAMALLRLLRRPGLARRAARPGSSGRSKGHPTVDG